MFKDQALLVDGMGHAQECQEAQQLVADMREMLAGWAKGLESKDDPKDQSEAAVENRQIVRKIREALADIAEDRQAMSQFMRSHGHDVSPPRQVNQQMREDVPALVEDNGVHNEDEKDEKVGLKEHKATGMARYCLLRFLASAKTTVFGPWFEGLSARRALVRCAGLRTQAREARMPRV